MERTYRSGRRGPIIAFVAGDRGRPHLTGSPPRSEATALLDGLFPSFVRGVAAHITDGCDSPFPEERDAVAAAASSRRREFVCGRACAHAALQALGRDRGPIGTGDRREPTWPDGVVGAISHAGSLVGAVVARAADARGLGLDIELLEPPLDQKLQRLLLTPGEIFHVQSLLATEPAAAKIIFSAKESVYKCLFPRTGRRLDPQEIDVALDPARRRYLAVIAGPRSVTPLEGSFRLADGYVLTGLHV